MPQLFPYIQAIDPLGSPPKPLKGRNLSGFSKIADRSASLVAPDIARSNHHETELWIPLLHELEQ